MVRCFELTIFFCCKVEEMIIHSFHNFIYISLPSFLGLNVAGKITYVTIGLPIVLLFVFLILGRTLEGSEMGIQAYIGEWDMSVLSTTRGDAWSTAVSQIFFSLSVTFGVMTAYCSTSIIKVVCYSICKLHLFIYRRVCRVFSDWK